MRKTILAAVVLAVLALGGVPAQAGIVTYSALDTGALPGAPHPNSAAAAASFDAAVGTYDLITFEGLTLGNFSSRTVATGVTATLANTAADACAGICDQSDVVLGYNTTLGGQNSLRVVPVFSGSDVSLTFAFTSPIDFFGAYITGTESDIDGTITVGFNDGTSQSLALPKNPGAVGGVQFFGFTDFGATISSVTFNEAGPFVSRDIWAIDDIRFGSVPDPGSTMLLFGTALAGLAGLWRTKRH